MTQAWDVEGVGGAWALVSGGGPWEVAPHLAAQQQPSLGSPWMGLQERPSLSQPGMDGQGLLPEWEEEWSPIERKGVSIRGLFLRCCD